MKLYRNLYVGNSLQGNERRVLRKLKMKGKAGNIYLICLPSNSENLLDIIPSWYSWQYEDLYVAGIAGGKQEAFEVTAEIVQDVYEKTDGFVEADFRGWWHSGQRSWNDVTGRK